MIDNIPRTYFPPGYVEAEAEFTKRQLLEFYQAQQILDRKREAVITRREEFKHVWYSNKEEELCTGCCKKTCSKKQNGTP